MTKLQTAMETLIEIFDTYTAADDCEGILTKAQVKTLMEKELPDLLETAKKNDGVDKFLNDLDLNEDKVIDFSEFMTVVCLFTCALKASKCLKSPKK